MQKGAISKSRARHCQHLPILAFLYFPPWVHAFDAICCGDMQLGNETHDGNASVL